MRQPELGRDARRDADGPVDAGRDDAVHALRLGEPLDPELVLGRDDRAAIGVTEPGRIRVAVDGDDVQVALVRGREEAELRGACA